MWHPQMLGVACAAAGTVGLSGCGDGSGGGNGVASQNAPAIFNDAVSAVKSAKSVHVSADLRSSYSLKADVVVVGGDYSGTVTLNGTAMKVVALSGKYYISGAGSWKTQAPPYAGRIGC